MVVSVNKKRNAKGIYTLIKLVVLVFILFWFQSFTTIDGKQITLEEIKKDNDKRVLLIFSSAPSCQDCYYWLAKEIKKLQKKMSIKVYIISSYKENIFERKMSSNDIKKKLSINLEEIYIFDEQENEFIKKYNVIQSPSILFINKSKEKYIPYNLIFSKDGLNRNVMEKNLLVR